MSDVVFGVPNIVGILWYKFVCAVKQLVQLILQPLELKEDEFTLVSNSISMASLGIPHLCGHTATVSTQHMTSSWGNLHRSAS
eukprot:6131261-Amphidinium_carterae.1